MQIRSKEGRQREVPSLTRAIWEAILDGTPFSSVPYWGFLRTWADRDTGILLLSALTQRPPGPPVFVRPTDYMRGLSIAILLCQDLPLMDSESGVTGGVQTPEPSKPGSQTYLGGFLPLRSLASLLIN